MEDVDFTFGDRADARRYLAEVGTLWAVWLLALFAVTFSSGGLRALAGVIGLVATVWRTMPLQNRAGALVTDEEARRNTGFRGGKRERTFRKLAYGIEPLRAAVPMAGASSVWYGLRIGTLGLTILGFVAVVVEYVG